MKPLLMKIARRTPGLGRVIADRERLRGKFNELTAERDHLLLRCSELGEVKSTVPLTFPPGHYYSPMTDPAEVEKRSDAIFNRMPASLPAVDMNDAGQAATWAAWKPFMAEAAFPANADPAWRYHYVNDWYPYGDAFCLYNIIRQRKPKRLIEVGSGYSSCVILDTNERWMNGSVGLTFVEPHPERLLSVLRPGEAENISLVRKQVQDVPVDDFRRLEAGDVLLIDSTHVSKCGSDVNYLYFEVLPALKPGVAVHVHDVWYPFEYPRDWVMRGFGWNEQYLLRAFLMYNSAFEVLFCNSYWRAFHAEEMLRDAPLAHHQYGGSIWIQKK